MERWNWEKRSSELCLDIIADEDVCLLHMNSKI